MRHARATDGLDQRFLNDAVFHIQRQLAGALLRCAPADAMRQAGNIGDLRGFYPFAFFRNGRGTVMGALFDAYHFFHFFGKLHENVLLISDCIHETAGLAQLWNELQ